jgi:hypothetical protein
VLVEGQYIFTNYSGNENVYVQVSLSNLMGNLAAMLSNKYGQSNITTTERDMGSAMRGRGLQNIVSIAEWNTPRNDISMELVRAYYLGKVISVISLRLIYRSPEYHAKHKGRE